MLNCQYLQRRFCLLVYLGGLGTELGQRIRTARESCCLTQEQLGNAVGRDIKAFIADTFVEHNPLAALFRTYAQLAEQQELWHALQGSLALGREMTNLERLLGIDRIQLHTATYEVPSAKTRWEAIKQGERIAADERQRLGLGLFPMGDLVELLESQGVRTGSVSLPPNISGLTLLDAKIDIFVVINSDHPALRRRFSLAHEYAHVLIDRDRSGVISRTENRAELLEVRANAFAAEFLMPAEGIMQFVHALGKGGASRAQMTVYDEADVVQVEQRAIPGSQDIQLYDVALLAHHFGVSRVSALYRLRNLRLIDEREFKKLKSQEDSGAGKAIADFLATNAPADKPETRDEFRRRFLGIALEAYRREEITESKFIELALMVGMDRQEVRRVLSSTGFNQSLVGNDKAL